MRMFLQVYAAVVLLAATIAGYSVKTDSAFNVEWYLDYSSPPAQLSVRASIGYDSDSSSHSSSSSSYSSSYSDSALSDIYSVTFTFSINCEFVDETTVYANDDDIYEVPIPASVDICTGLEVLVTVYDSYGNVITQRYMNRNEECASYQIDFCNKCAWSSPTPMKHCDADKFCFHNGGELVRTEENYKYYGTTIVDVFLGKVGLYSIWSLFKFEDGNWVYNSEPVAIDPSVVTIHEDDHGAPLEITGSCSYYTYGYDNYSVKLNHDECDEYHYAVCVMPTINGKYGG